MRQQTLPPQRLFATISDVHLGKINNVLSRREFLTQFSAAAPVVAATSPVPALDVRSAEVAGDLKADENQKNPRKITYGSAVVADALNADPAYYRAVAEYCGIVVPESELKWTAVHPGRREFDFSKADLILRFAESHKIAFKGHTLVWAAAMPDWTKEIATPTDAEAELTFHIQTVVTHYLGKARYWDVINEPIAPAPKTLSDLRSSIWTRFLGPAHIPTALRIAHSSDPSALLFINEFDLEYRGPKSQMKREALLKLLRELRDKDVPLHGVGIQGHLEPGNPIDCVAFEEFLATLQEMNLEVIISELDVIDSDLPADIRLRDALVASKTYEFLSCVCNVVGPSAIITWGISDKYSWVPTSYPRADGLPSRPLPLDVTMHPKEMFAVIQEFLGK